MLNKNMINKILRFVGVVISSTSILALLVEFYGIIDMSSFTKLVFVPSMIILALLTYFSWKKRYEDFWKRCVIGSIAGFLATVAYDLIRIPFLLYGINLFKAIFQFGPLILGELIERGALPLLISDIIGWIYHFSNGITFGLILVFSLFRPRWWQALIWGVVLELAMLFTPYPQFFGIKLTFPFILGSFIGHIAYGLTLGIIIEKMWERFLPKNLKVAIKRR
jgi:hypothetical protein